MIKKVLKVRPRNYVAANQYIKSAEDDFAEDDFGAEDDMLAVGDDDGMMDAISDMQDDIEDIQDSVEDIKEDEVDIEINNNIANHYIAECASCQGVFISAVVQSDQEVEKITGVCPLCGKETDQYLKWVIKDVKDAEEVEGM